MGNKAYKERHRALGLCDYCTQPAVEGLKVCETHREKQRKNYQDKYRKRVAEGLCVRCGKPATVGKLCAYHVSSQKHRHRKYYLAHKAELDQKVRDRRAKMAREGRCRDCGDMLGESDNKSKCWVCSERDRLCK